MKQLIHIKEIIEEAITRTKQIIELQDEDRIVAKEYFLGKKAGLQYSLSLIECYIKDNTPWEE